MLNHSSVDGRCVWIHTRSFRIEHKTKHRVPEVTRMNQVALMLLLRQLMLLLRHCSAFYFCLRE